MSWARAAVIVGSIALGGALLLGLLGRAPATLRAMEPGREATDPSLGARFAPEQKRRAAAYNGPRYAAFVLVLVIQVVLLVVLVRGPFVRLADAYARAPGGWAPHAALLAITLVLLATVATLPVTYVRGFLLEHAWGLSTQGVGDWLLDRVRSAAVSSVTAAVAAVAFFGIVRWQPRAWWVWVWGVFALLSALLVFLWPVVVAPLFNRFTPLGDPALSQRTRALAREAGVEVKDVLVADASRRTTTANAYVAGFGGTKRLVLYDTLLASGSEKETLYVVGHELGHEREHHILKSVGLGAVGLALGLGALVWLSERTSVLQLSGASGIGDLRAMPALLLFVTVASVVALPAENAFSRAFERRADEIAVELTNDAPTAVRVLRRLALRNISDLDPPALAVALLYSHPPIPERIRAVLREARPTLRTSSRPRGRGVLRPRRVSGRRGRM